MASNGGIGGRRELDPFEKARNVQYPMAKCFCFDKIYSG